MILASILVLKFLCLIVLFKGVLGYEFRENRLWIAAGAAMFAVQWVLITVNPNSGYSGILIQALLLAGGTVMMFAGKKNHHFSDRQLYDLYFS